MNNFSHDLLRTKEIWDEFDEHSRLLCCYMHIYMYRPKRFIYRLDKARFGPMAAGSVNTNENNVLDIGPCTWGEHLS